MRRLSVPVLVAALLVAGGPLGAYRLSGHKWAVADVALWINPVNADMSEAAATTAILNAAAHWSQQSSADIRFYYAGRTSGTALANNGRNEVFFRNITNGGLGGATYYWYDANGRLLDSDTVFYDAGNTFFAGSSGCSGGHYLEDVATHELGHALGLGHSNVTEATMYPSVSVWCTQAWRTLSADDRAGIEALYPGGATSPSPPPPSEPPPPTSTAPAAPSNPSPANGATNVQTSSVAWGAASGASAYDVYFGPSTSPPRIAAGLVTTSVSVGQLAAGTRYYWRVVARNSAGATAGATWSFTTKAAKTKGGNGRGGGKTRGKGYFRQR